MKILILSSASSIHTQRWVRGLKDNNFDVELFSIFAPTSDEKLKYKSMKIHVNSCFSKGSKINIYSKYFIKFFYLLSIPKIKKQIRIFKPDIVHAHYVSSYGILGSVVGFKRFFVSAWGDDVFIHRKNFILKKLISFSLKKAVRIFSTSKAISDVIKKDYNLDSQIIPFGVDTIKFKPHSRKMLNPITIGLIKSLEPYNGIENLLLAFKTLLLRNINDIQLLIIGEGSFKDKLEKLVKELNINDKVTFLGKIDHSEIVKYYNKISIFVCPSIRESFGVSIIEASSCQLPVIGNNVGGIKEVIKDGKTGYLIDTSDTTLLADTIQKFILNDKLIKNFGLNGRKFVMENFEWKSNVKQLISHYEL